MADEPTGGPETYFVTCFTCGKKYDAVPAGSCRCLVRERTLVCPHCGHCFCRETHAHRLAFWASAPPALWERRASESGSGFVPPANPSPAEVRRPLVLVVDDEKEIQAMAIRAVRMLGYGVILARNGEEGLTLANLYVPDLVLTDAFMPKLDGREMCRLIKQNPPTKDVKVVVMTSLYTSAQHRADAERSFRVDGYLAKPVDFRKLEQILSSLLPKSGDAAG
jgi:CheY-like chemotaxis protein